MSLAPHLPVAEVADRLKEAAAELGFDLAAICPAITPTGVTQFHEWLSAGYAGEMSYLADRAEAYGHPQSVLDGVRSIMMLALVYKTESSPAPSPGEGRVASYAWGMDYHDLLHERLRKLVGVLRELVPTAKARGVVDSAPLLEREFAVLAGLGWIGKNTLVLNRRLGSWFFLAALLTDLELPPDEPHTTDHCGTCRACLDACPTDAFVQPYVLDARRCISYLTIEHRSAIPLELREGMGDWLFGCDVCQDVCPWNHRSPASPEPAFRPAPDHRPGKLAELFALDDEAFRSRFRDTPLWRPKRRGLLRNAAIVLGNRPTPEALGGLIHGLRDAEPLVRGACAWALGRYGNTPAAGSALRQQRDVESDADVQAEIDAALARI